MLVSDSADGTSDGRDSVGKFAKLTVRRINGHTMRIRETEKSRRAPEVCSHAATAPGGTNSQQTYLFSFLAFSAGTVRSVDAEDTRWSGLTRAVAVVVAG